MICRDMQDFQKYVIGIRGAIISGASSKYMLDAAPGEGTNTVADIQTILLLQFASFIWMML